MKEQEIPFLAHAAGEFFWWVNTHIPRVETKGLENVPEIKEHLKNGTAILYFNHSSLFDPGMILRTIHEHFGDLKKVGFFTSQRHLDETNGFFSKIKSRSMTTPSITRGFELLPVVQDKDKNKYPDWEKINTASVNRAIEILTEVPGGILAMAPTGTRSETLIEAKPGAIALLRKAKDKCIAVPVGVIGARQHWPTPNHIYPIQARVVIGKKITYEEILAKSRAEKIPAMGILMYELAEILPPSYQGFYARPTSS
ncbi:MAG: 1-acyl-sn-glycerol-3-phosphate acyltransferase [Candidatus Levybacteria bacterium]|nr:1-acyl-sn-glycerol-3-phosphate acyltransferase [Candidatus Levybacteria bacterium]